MSLNRSRGSRDAGYLGLSLLLLLAALPSTGNALDDKGYLDAISQEADKVEQRPAGERSDANNPGSAATQLPPASDGARTASITLEQFEEKLKQDYLGTYTLYMKLSQRSKEEIYESHVKGTRLDDLREKVLIRYNHDNTKN